MTEQDLTKKILHDAKQQAQNLITTAQQKAEAQITDAQENAMARKNIALQKAQAELDQRKTQQVRANEVLQIKSLINAQQKQIDLAFSQAQEKLLHASDDEIRQFVKHYTQKYAQPNDKVIIAQAWSTALPDLPTTDTISGGIIIENDTYRFEFDIDSILNELRADLAPEVAKLLGVI